MFIWTAKLSRRRGLLSVLLALALFLLALGLSRLGRPGTETARLETDRERVQYLESFGWSLEETPLETMQLTLPDPLTDDLAAYAAMQTRQGLPFADYAGRQVLRCTYAVQNYPHRKQVQANLYTCQGLPIGGDILCPGADGFQAPLAFPEAP